MYKVSVVIPVYNVEDYIVHCAESLFSQTLDDMQFIFVDDASPDNSIALLEQTIERFPQRKPHTIILHHPENLGLPTARATGLARVEAPYVAHCDSDDFVDPTMYAKLYENAIQNDSDMVVCGRKRHFVDGRESVCLERIRPADNLILMFLYEQLCPCVWCRLTKTTIYRQVKFPKHNFCEDWVQTAQLLTFVKRVSFLQEPLYHYNRHPLSITTDLRDDMFEEMMQQRIANFNLVHDFIVAHHQVKEKDFVFKKQRVRYLYLLQTKRWELRKKYLQTFPEINICLLFDRRVPFRCKAHHLLVLLGIHQIAKSLYDRIRKKPL